MPIQANYATTTTTANPRSIPRFAPPPSDRCRFRHIESVRRDRHGNYWFGDEFGPYLIKTDAQGTVRSEIPMPNVFAPENKAVVAGRPWPTWASRI